MPAKINCPYCGAKILNTLESYADHIFKKHSDNLELCAWTRAELVKIGKSPENIIPKYMGKPIDRIPPARKEKLSKLSQKLLRRRNEDRKEYL